MRKGGECFAALFVFGKHLPHAKRGLHAAANRLALSPSRSIGRSPPEEDVAAQ